MHIIKKQVRNILPVNYLKILYFMHFLTYTVCKIELIFGSFAKKYNTDILIYADDFLLFNFNACFLSFGSMGNVHALCCFPLQGKFEGISEVPLK